jgi:hypothetical protein
VGALAFSMASFARGAQDGHSGNRYQSPAEAGA